MSLSPPSENKPIPNDLAHTKLPEEIKFDKRVYGGISYAGQAGTGIVLTNWITHGGGRKYFDLMSEWAGPNLIGKITSKTGPAAIKEAHSWIVVSTMIMVGNAFLWPVKWLEDRKPKIVRGMTERDNAKREARGETISAGERAHQEARLAQLEREPPQDWPTLWKARGASLIGVYAGLHAIGNDRNKFMAKATENAAKEIASGVGLKSLSRSKGFGNIMNIAFYDGFYSMISAGGLYVYSHLVDPPHKKKQQEPEAEMRVAELRAATQSRGPA